MSTDFSDRHDEGICPSKPVLLGGAAFKRPCTPQESSELPDRRPQRGSDMARDKFPNMSANPNTPSHPESRLHLDEQLLKSESIGEKIESINNSLPPEGVTLAEIRDIVGQDGLLILTAFLTVVFLVPVSVPGVSTVFGAAILLIGITRLFGLNLWLPRRIADKVLPSEKLRSALDVGGKWVHRLERISRPHRMPWLASPGLADTINNLALTAGAVLLMAPFGLIPFSNTFPALAVLFLAIGLLERDGLFIVLGHAANLLTVVYFSVLLFIGAAALGGILQRLFGGS